MKKKLPLLSLRIPAPPKKLASILLIATAAAAQAEIVVNESFTGYNSSADLLGQAVTGVGLTGNWTGSQFFRTDDTGLTMAGVASSGGSLKIPGKAGSSTTGTVTAQAAFNSPLSASTTYSGSYLFQFTANGTNGRTTGGVMTGGLTDGDNAASFGWFGDNYNNTANNINGPGLRTENSPNVVPSMSLTNGTTYIMLFQFNASAQTTTAWVLSEAQLTSHSSSLDATTLNAATDNTTDASGVTWRATATTTNAVGSMDYLIGFGGRFTDADYVFTMDEIRFSDANLSEAVTAVPEPSTIAILGLAFGAFAIRGVLRRRRQA